MCTRRRVKQERHQMRPGGPWLPAMGRNGRRREPDTPSGLLLVGEFVKSGEDLARDKAPNSWLIKCAGSR